MYSYDDSPVRQERLAKGTDHCSSSGIVYALGELVNGGQIKDPRTRQALTTVGTSSRKNSVLIFAVDANFNIHVGFDGERGRTDAVKHETLFHNADVRAAGELTVIDGIIVAVNDHSGSYRTAGELDTDRRFAEAVLTAIERISAPLHDSASSGLREKAGRR